MNKIPICYGQSATIVALPVIHIVFVGWIDINVL